MERKNGQAGHELPGANEGSGREGRWFSRLTRGVRRPGQVTLASPHLDELRQAVSDLDRDPGGSRGV